MPRSVSCLGILLSVLVGIGLRSSEADDSRAKTPNIVLIFTDDQGYGDLGCYGATGFRTPNLDRLAAEGMRFTDFYVAQAVCGASRAAMLTGCYPNRLGMLGAPGPKSTHGIHPDEVLLPELVKSKGYATAAIGKWHLGHHAPFLPTKHGFDSYFGLPYSNDMWPYHPTAKDFPPLPLIEGEAVVNRDVSSADQELLTTRYTERAVQFIDQHRAQPFLLYVAHAMPHVPLHVSEKFRGKSAQGAYGDVIEEIDWSVGQILEALNRHDIADDTLVIFTTDNGPWLSYGNHAGSAGPLREGKGTTWEGGVRVPCVMRWPGRIPAGTVCHELAATIDLFPTIATLVDAKLPSHPIDGLDITGLMTNPAARTPHEAYFFYWGNELQAVRSGDWKLHFPHKYPSLAGKAGVDGKPDGYQMAETGLALFNLKDDIGEMRDVKAEHPDVVEQLERLADAIREELGDSAREKVGRGYRPPATWTPVLPESVLDVPVK